MKNRFSVYLSLLFLLSTFLTMYADDYRVLFVNSKDLTIGNKVAKNGMTFSDTDKINWKNEKQYMRVRNMSTHKTYLISQADFEKGSPSTIQHLFVTKRLSTRELGNKANIIDSPLLMLDTLYIPTGKKYEGKIEHYVRIKDSDTQLPAGVLKGKQYKKHRVESSVDGEYLLLPRSLFNGGEDEIINVDILETTPDVITVSKESDILYPLYEDLSIRLLPLD